MSKFISSLAVMASLFCMVTTAATLNTAQAETTAEKSDRLSRVKYKLQRNSLSLEVIDGAGSKSLVLTSNEDRRIVDIQDIFVKDSDLSKYWDNAAVTVIFVRLKVPQHITLNLPADSFRVTSGAGEKLVFIDILFDKFASGGFTPKAAADFLKANGLENAVFVSGKGYKKKSV